MKFVFKKIDFEQKLLPFQLFYKIVQFGGYYTILKNI